MLFDRKEKEVEKLFLEHFAKVADALNHLKELIRCYLKCDKEFKEASLRVHQSEHEADLIKQAIEAKLYEGAFLPINRGDYILLAEFIDRIANQAETTANLVVLTRPAIPDFIRGQLDQLLNSAIAASTALKNALESIHKKPGKIQNAIQQVVTCEEEADRQEWEAIKSVFKSDLDLAHKLHLRELVRDIAAISDLAEDVGERMGIMVMKRPL